ncbi:putative ABC transporter permease [Oscillospiraceae bacterium OttesenSCG-928-G22]|nr:putative ABC transporter permease [Oscillospiraceae bacterium OttesenSCG-928-G22]
MRFSGLALIFFSYSFIGWLLEVLYAFYVHRRFVNRGFCNGALCPMYGVAGLLATLSLNPLRAHPIVVFFIGALLISAVEFVTGVLMERLFGARWWDYSDERFNIMGYISLRFTILWGVMSLVLVYLLNPLLDRFFSLFSEPLLFLVGISLTALFAFDVAVTVRSAIGLSSTVKEIESFLRTLPEKFDVGLQRTKHRIQNGHIYLSTKESTEEWSKKVRYLQIRLMKSFPEMHYRDNFKEAFEILKDATKKRLKKDD